MATDLRPAATMVDAQVAVSWAAIAAGAVAAAALSFFLNDRVLTPRPL